MFWIKAVSALRKLLPIIVPPLMEVIKERAYSHPRTPDHAVHENPIKDAILELRRDLERQSLHVEKLAQHVLTLQRTVRWTAWMSIVSCVMAVTAILWGLRQ
jgi:hypothetical protein